MTMQKTTPHLKTTNKDTFDLKEKFTKVTVFGNFLLILPYNENNKGENFKGIL